MLSEDKVTHLSHVVLKGLLERGLVTLLEEDGKVRRAIKGAVMVELKLAEEMQEAVRKKLESYSRNIAEGSPEWEILYKKFLKEEEVKRGRQ